MFKQIRGVVETIVKLALFAFRRLLLYILSEPLLNGLIWSWIKQQELIILSKKVSSNGWFTKSECNWLKGKGIVRFSKSVM